MNEPIILRALEATDLERCHSWHNDRSLYETLCDHFRFVSSHAEEKWLEQRTSYANSSSEVSLAMCVRESGRHIGNIYLRQINWISRRAELSIFIGDLQHRSRGFGQSAVKQLLAYAFNDLGLKRVYLGVLSDNPAAIHIYEKCGFKIEGTLRNHDFKDGEWKDEIIMGVCAGENTMNGPDNR